VPAMPPAPPEPDHSEPPAPGHELERGEEVLDQDVISELRELDAGVVRDLIELYFRDSVAQMPQLARAIDCEDAAGVAALAHRFKGASLAVGAALVSSIASELEQRAKDDDLALAPQLLGLLEQELSHTRQMLAAQFPETLS
jgi:histidine phosphotransfer protein HptB